MTGSPEEQLDKINVCREKIAPFARAIEDFPYMQRHEKNVFQGILLQISDNQKRIVTGYQSKDLPLLAWGTRNALELSTWAEYAAKSKENCLRLFDEQALDGKSIIDGLVKFIKLMPEPSEHQPLADTLKENLDLAIVAAGLQIDSPYLRFKQFVKQEHGGDKYEAFSFIHHMLSKFVHPTALVITASIDPDQVFGVAGSFLDLGTYFSCWTVDYIGTHAYSLICEEEVRLKQLTAADLPAKT